MNGSVAYLVTGLGCLIAVAGIVVAVVAMQRSRRGTGGRPGRWTRSGTATPTRCGATRAG